MTGRRISDEWFNPDVPPDNIPGLTEAQMEWLVKKVSQEVINEFYVSVGRSVTQKIMWFIGVVSVGILAWLAGTGKMSLFK